MHKCLLFFVFALMTCFAANAAPVSAEAAGCRAAAFLHKDAGQLQLLKSPYEYLYLFAFEEGGFAVVSADDRVPPILGYSDKGVLTVDGMPPALAAWLADCDSVVRAAAGDASLPMHAGWLEQGAPKGPESYDSIVGPLLSTTWDQSVWLELTHKTPSKAIITVEVSQGGVEDSDFVEISTLPASNDIVSTQPINLSEYYQGNPVRIAVRMRVQPDASNVLFELHGVRMWKNGEGVQDAVTAMPSFSPNPAWGRVAVSLPSPDGVLSLFDVRGRQVMRRQVSSTETTIDVSALPGGVYLLHYSSARGTSTSRLVVR